MQSRCYSSLQPPGQKSDIRIDPFAPLQLPSLTLPLNYEALRLHGRRRVHQRARQASAGPLVPVPIPPLDPTKNDFRSAVWAPAWAPRHDTPAAQGRSSQQRRARGRLSLLLSTALDWDTSARHERPPPRVDVIPVERSDGDSNGAVAVSFARGDVGVTAGEASSAAGNLTIPMPTPQQAHDFPALVSADLTATGVGLRASTPPQTTSSLFRRLHRLPPALAPVVLCFLDGDHLWAALFAVAAEAAAIEVCNSSSAQTKGPRPLVGTELPKRPVPAESCAGDSFAAATSAATFGAESSATSLPQWSFLTSAMSSLWPSLDREWLHFVTWHRAAHEQRAESGDLSLDVECAVWPDAMGDVEHEPPVWVKNPGSDAAWQAEHATHDEGLRLGHRRLLAQLLRLLDDCMATAACLSSEASSQSRTSRQDTNAFEDPPSGGPRDIVDDFYDADTCPLVSLAPVVVFGGGAAAVRCALEVQVASARRRAAKAPVLGSLAEDWERARRDHSFVVPGHRRGFGVCLSGLGDRVPGCLLASTVLNHSVTRALVRLDLRGLVLTFASTAAVSSVDGEDRDKDSSGGVAGASSVAPDPHPLSVLSRLGRGAAAKEDAATEARADALATALMGRLGAACCCLQRLDLSGLFFRLEERAQPSSSSTEEGKQEGAAKATTVGLSDASLGALVTGLARHRNMRKLALGGANQLSDLGLRRLGEALGRWLTDLSLYSCYRVGDIGIMHVAKPGLLRVNYCGCYKVTDAGRRRLISVNHRILTYNKAKDFGLPHPSESRAGGNARAVFESRASDVRVMRESNYALFGPLG